MNIKPKADVGIAQDAQPISSGFDGRDLVIIIVNYRTPEHVARCLDSLAAERLRTPGFSVVVVDGGSGDGSAEQLARLIADSDIGHWVRLIALGVNGGFGYANNQAMLTLAAEGRLPETVLLLNPDTVVQPGALGALLNRLASDSRIGAVGARLENEDGSIQGSAFAFTTIRNEFCRAARTGALDRLLRRRPHVLDGPDARRAAWVTGAAVLLRRAALSAAGLFDDGFFLYFEEAELQHRMTRAGWHIWHEPAARVVHAHGVSTGLGSKSKGDAPQRARLPAYWYRSRRRYLVRTGGALFAILAGFASLAGHAFWRLRCLITRRPDDGPLRAGRDLLRLGFWPSRSDRRAVPPRLGDHPGTLPAWVEDAPR